MSEGKETTHLHSWEQVLYHQEFYLASQQRQAQQNLTDRKQTKGKKSILNQNQYISEGHSPAPCPFMKDEFSAFIISVFRCKICKQTKLPRVYLQYCSVEHNSDVNKYCSIRLQAGRPPNKSQWQLGQTSVFELGYFSPQVRVSSQRPMNWDESCLLPWTAEVNKRVVTQSHTSH